MHCLISKEKIDPFHIFEKRTILNKPVRDLPEIATTSMELGYCKNTSHISSRLGLTDEKIASIHEEIYTKLYETYAEIGLSPLQKSYTDFVAKWLLKSMKKNSSVLEIGCHDGYLLSKIAKEGHAVTGLEPSPMANFAKDNFGINVQNEFFTKESLNGEKFDFIILRHVIEHVQDPVEFLQNAYGKLNKNGLIYIEVPNSLWSLTNSFFPEFHIDHISYFTQASLKKLILTLRNVEILHLEQFMGYIKFPFLGALIRKTNIENSINYPQNHMQDFIIPNAINKFTQDYANYINNLKSIDSSEGIVVWGTGSIGTQFSVDADWGNDNENVYYVDINRSNHGMIISTTGHKIFSPEIIKKIKPSSVIVASAWESDVLNQMQQFLSGREKIITYTSLLENNNDK